MSFSLFIPLFSKFVDCNIPYISKLGEGTLGVYVVHITIFTWLIHDHLLCTDLSGMLYVLYVAILTIIVFLFSYIICLLIGKNKILSKILLGK